MEDKVQKAYDFLNQHKNNHLKEFVKTFNESDGFVFSISEQYIEIMDGIGEEGHSSASLALCMRVCQKLFNLESQISL